MRLRQWKPFLQLPPLAARPRGSTRTSCWRLVAVAQFMIVLDATIVNVALPTIQGDLGFSQQNLLWVLNAYTLVFGGFLLLGGRLADRLGRRRLFMAGTALFAGRVTRLRCWRSRRRRCWLRAAPRDWVARMVSPAALSIILTTFAEGTRAQPRTGGLGRDRRSRRRDGPAPRRRDRRSAELALDLLRQRPDRRRCSWPLVPRRIPESRSRGPRRPATTSGAPSPSRWGPSRSCTY